MGRRSRHTAKTGDKAIYKSRTSTTDDTHRRSHGNDDSDDDDDDNDPMYNEVERYHLRKEDENFMKLDGGDSSDDDEEEEDDGITKHQEGVFDLGIGGSSDDEEEDEDSDQDDEDDAQGQKRTAAAIASSSDDDDDDSEEDDDEEDGYKSKLLNWGDKKHSYYHGDTADLEIGQNIEDAYLEEEAGREVEKARLQEMDDADFMLDGGIGGDDGDDVQNTEEEDARSRKKKSKANDQSNMEKIQSIPSSRQNLSKLPKGEKVKFLKANHPELLPLVQHFTPPIQELSETTILAAGALLKRGVVNGAKEAKAVGATTAGLQYLIAKSMLQASNALNLSLYLLLKADVASKKNDEMALVEEDDGDYIRAHPVMDRLNQLSRLTDKLKEGVEDKIPGLQDQLNNLVKAAALMEGGDLSSSEDSESSDEEGTSSSDLREDDESFKTSAQQLAPPQAGRSKDDIDEKESSDSDDESETQEDIRRRIMTEAKFALRNQDIDHDEKKSTKRKRRIARTSYDYGDETEEIDERALAASRKLASRMNSIVQKSTSSSEKRKILIGAEEDGVDDEYDNLQRGLAMMEDDIGKGSDNDDDEDRINGNEDNIMEGFESEEDEFYSLIKSKSKARKDAKKQMYTVAPKYPRLEEEIDGERSIGKTILKNRGLVPHKPKINRNPRVKKREQYRKALIRRKGAVREVRTDEGHVYGGEATGIKSGISRSRKLAR